MCPAPWTDSPPPLLMEDDYTSAPRPHPLSHPPVDAPLCITCTNLDLSFFDPSCPGCHAIIKSRETSIGQILAIMRQWVPQTQHAIDTLVLEVLKRGAHPDDRDSLTDMTLIMYAVKSGASGVGNVDTATKMTEYLIEHGADLSARCRWTDMAALHYATYFDVAPVLSKLLHKTKGADVDTHCVEYENGTALHIAASNLSLGAARVLLKFGANLEAIDDLGRRPIECIPDAADFELVPDAQELITKMTRLLSDGLEDRGGRSPSTLTRGGTKSISGRTVLQAMGLKVNDRVVVGSKLGTLRFCGTTEFATGMWAGVELDTQEGKNDGTVRGIRYFRCEPDYGIFVPANKVAKAGSGYRGTVGAPARRHNSKSIVNYGKVDVSHVRAKFHTAMAIIAERSEIRVGDRVFIKEVLPGRGSKGVVRFIGSVDFVDDMTEWYGIELDSGIGRHDGTVQGVRYFAAGKDRGVFVTANKIIKLDTQDNYEESCDVSVCDSESSAYRTDPYQQGQQGRSTTATPTHRVRRSLSLRHHEIKTGQSVTSAASSITSSLSRSMSVRRSVEKNQQQQPAEFQTGPGPAFNKFKKKLDKKYLEVGQSVMCISNREMATVRYIGHTDFAPGIWIGLELKNPKGKHSGEVDGRRYFSCKENHGVMVRPRIVSVHGISAQDLLKPENEYPI